MLLSLSFVYLLRSHEKFLPSNVQEVALLGAEGFGLLNAFFVFHLLHDAIAGGIQMTQEQLFPSFLVFLSHGRGALAENDVVHKGMGGNNSDCSNCSKSNQT